jgi:Nucleotidyl transferase AbiEii toxin, Type IV TA system
MAVGNSGADLSPFQLEVARLFFALPASQGFLLAGGAALLAQHLTARPTEDLDFFTAP